MLDSCWCQWDETGEISEIESVNDALFVNSCGSLIYKLFG